MVALTIDGSQIKRLVNAVDHIEKGVPRIVKPIVKRILDKGQQTVTRCIQAVYMIKTADIWITTETKGDMGGSIVIKGGMLRLTRFPHHPYIAPQGRMQSPMWAQVRVGGGGVMPGGFMTASARGIYIRSKGAGRLPINWLLTIGAPIMASQPEVGPIANEQLGNELADMIDAEIDKLFSQTEGE